MRSAHYPIFCVTKHVILHGQLQSPAGAWFFQPFGGIGRYRVLDEDRMAKRNGPEPDFSGIGLFRECAEISYSEGEGKAFTGRSHQNGVVRGCLLIDNYKLHWQIPVKASEEIASGRILRHARE